MRKIVLFFGLFFYSATQAQIIQDAFTDGNFSSNLVWTGNFDTRWSIVPDANAGLLTLGSNTLRLNDFVSGNSYLSTENSNWGSFQAWTLWWGREGILDVDNSQYFWLFSDRADVTDPSVNGYRLALIAGPIEGDPEVIQLQKVVNGVPDGQSIIEITFPSLLLDPGDPFGGTIPMSDFGFSLRITRSASNAWNIFTNYDIANLVPGDGEPATTSGFGASNFTYAAVETGTPIPITGTGYISIHTISVKDPLDGTSGGPEFDQIQFQANGALPVTLESLKAVKDGSSKARLEWKVGIEDNVKGYEIERSPNGVNFSKIGFVQAIGSRNYGFNDLQILPGRNFYRLKTVDNDGTYKYSFIVSVNGASETSLKVFPNPVKNNLFVQHADAGAQARLRIFGMDGRLVQFIRVPENAVQTNINVTSLKPGIYNLIYEDVTGERQVSKFIKQ